MKKNRIDLTAGTLLCPQTPFSVKKNSKISPAAGWVCLLYADGRIAAKPSEPAEYRLGSLCPEIMGKVCTPVLVKKGETSPLLWGFGEMLVRDAESGEDYFVGANGTLSFAVSDAAVFAGASGIGSAVTIEALRAWLLPMVAEKGKRILSSFWETEPCRIRLLPSFLEPFEKALGESLAKDLRFSGMGLSLSRLDTTSFNTVKKPK